MRHYHACYLSKYSPSATHRAVHLPRTIAHASPSYLHPHQRTHLPHRPIAPAQQPSSHNKPPPTSTANPRNIQNQHSSTPKYPTRHPNNTISTQTTPTAPHRPLPSSLCSSPLALPLPTYPLSLPSRSILLTSRFKSRISVNWVFTRAPV